MCFMKTQDKICRSGPQRFPNVCYYLFLWLFVQACPPFLGVVCPWNGKCTISLSWKDKWIRLVINYCLYISCDVPMCGWHMPSKHKYWSVYSSQLMDRADRKCDYTPNVWIQTHVGVYDKGCDGCSQGYPLM